MRPVVTTTFGALILMACGGTPPANSPSEASAETQESSATQAAEAPPTEATDPEPEAGSGDGNEFKLGNSDTAGAAHGESESKIKATETEAAMKFLVVDQNKGPVKGIVISMTAPDGKKYYTGETDGTGYAEVLVPNGQKYDLVYLSLGRQDVTTAVTVNNDKKQNIKLTLRYKNKDPDATPGRKGPAGFVLKGITFDTAKATIRPESISRLDGVLEFLTYKRSARIQIQGHTDNIGKPQANKLLSEHRAQAVRDYLIKNGIDKSRVEAVGFGDEQPIATNDTEEGRQKNRRIEAREL